MELALRASHYVDAAFELRRDVILLISGGHVAEVIEGGEVSSGLDGLARHTLDLGDAVILPGFVNAHAHLDLSHLWRQVPYGLAFHEWAPAIIAGRQVAPDIVARGIEDGCRMAVAGGTTAVVDISVGGDSAPVLAGQGLRGAVALEVLGPAEPAMERLDAVVRARFELDRARLGSNAGASPPPAAPENVDWAYSPHAPYSTGRELYQHAFGRAFGEGRLCATHVAETREEIQFIRDGSGPLRELLTRLGVNLGDFAGYGVSPLALLLEDWLAPWLGEQNPRLLLVHCNYPQEGDLERIARVRPSVCWCPRSHAWFGHSPWPLAEIHAAGANLVLGTDSLASNDGLDMLGEIREAARTHPDAPRVELFKAATVNGRRLLGLGDDVADLTVFALPPEAASFRLEALLNALIGHNPPLAASVVAGSVVARAI
jgi:aminodeoxyfutalosine deaminase